MIIAVLDVLVLEEQSQDKASADSGDGQIRTGKTNRPESDRGRVPHPVEASKRP